PRLPASGEVLDLHGDHIGPRRGERDGDDRLVQRVATAEDPRDRGVDDQLVLADLDVVHLRRALQRDAVADQPVAVGELHGGPPEVGRDQGRRTRSPRSASGPARRTRTRPVGRSPSATTRWGRGGAGSGAADGVGASSSAVPTAAAGSAPGSGAVSRAVTSVPAGRTNSAVPPASVRGRSSVPSSSEAGAKRSWSRCSARYAGTISSAHARASSGARASAGTRTSTCLTVRVLDRARRTVAGPSGSSHASRSGANSGRRRHGKRTWAVTSPESGTSTAAKPIRRVHGTS